MSPVRPLGPASIFTPRKTRGVTWEGHPPCISDVGRRGQGVEGCGGERGVGRMGHQRRSTDLTEMGISVQCRFRVEGEGGPQRKEQTSD